MTYFGHTYEATANDRTFNTGNERVDSNYDEKYGLYTTYSSKYKRVEVFADLNDGNYTFLYQDELNPDYLTFDRYDNYKVHAPEYEDLNANRKVQSVYDVKDCGDCVRGGFIYCTQSDIFSKSYSSQGDKPKGVCCQDEKQCN